MKTFHIPTPFRTYTNGASLIELQAHDIHGAIAELVDNFPDLHRHIFTEDGTLHTFVNLFLNGEDIRYLQGLDTRLQPGDKLQIIPSIAGG